MPWETLLPLAFASSGSSTSTGAGALLAALLLVWGIGRCVTISRRPTTNTKAALALAAVLGGWLLLYSTSALRAAGLPAVLHLAFVPLALAGLLAGVGLAFAGLVEMGRRPEAFVQGRKQAWWGIGLGTALSLLALFVVGDAVTGSKKSIVPSVAAVDSRPVTFEELNFRFTPPNRSWARLEELTKVNPDATVGYVHAHPSMIFMVIAESYPDIGRDIGVDALAEVARSNLKSTFEEVEDLGREEFEVNGLTGSLLFTRARLGRNDLHYVHWLHSRRDFIYQVVVGGDSKRLSGAELREHAEELLAGFELIHGSASYRGPAGELVGAYQSPRHGFTLDLSDSDWRLWPDLESDYPEAEIGGQRGAMAGFVVIPVELGGRQPEIEALADGLGARIGISLADGAVSDLRPISGPSADGLSFRLLEDGLDYRIQVLQTGSHGYLVAEWDRAGASHPGGGAQTVIDRFVLSAGAGRPAESSSPTAREQSAYSLVLNDIGVFYYEAARFGESSDYFRQALQWNPDDAQVLENLVDALSRQGLFQEALDTLQPRVLMTRDNPELKAYLAFLRAEAGQLEAAAEDYHELFATGHQSDHDLTAYADLLFRLDRTAVAVAEVEAYRSTRDSAAAASLAADLHRRLGEYEPAVEVLTRALEQRPFNRELMIDLVGTYHECERYQDAVRAAASVIARGAAPTELFLLKGRSELALGRYEPARASFEDALAADPADARAQDYLDYLGEMLARQQQSPQTGP